MNRKIGIYSSAINVIAVLGVSLSMLLGSDVGSYLLSMFIAFSFVLMVCAYTYFAQLTTVQNSDLTKQARILLDFQQFDFFL